MIWPRSHLRGTATWATASSSRSSRSEKTSVRASSRAVASPFATSRIMPDAMAVTPTAVSVADVEEAATVISGRLRETPLLSAGELSRRVGARVLLKAENLQVTGSFKARGATNVVRRLPDDALRTGVVAASAGNHAQAVARAARDARARALLVMPGGAPLAKVAAGRPFAGEVRLHGATYDDAQAEARRLSQAEGRTLVHPFDAPEGVAGQGAVGLEGARAAPGGRVGGLPPGGGG